MAEFDHFMFRNEVGLCQILISLNILSFCASVCYPHTNNYGTTEEKISFIYLKFCIISNPCLFAFNVARCCNAAFRQAQI